MNKVVQIAHSAPGGASDLCAILAIAGQADGVRQELAFWGNEPAWRDRVRRCEEHGIRCTAFLKKKGLDPAAHRPVFRWVRSHWDAAAVIIHYPPALFAVRAALRGSIRPQILLVEHHSNQLKSARKWLTSLLALWMADGVVYLTPAYRDQVAAKLGMTFRPKRCRVIPNGLDLERYLPPQNLPPRPGTRRTIGMSARFMHPKDHVTLIDAFAKLTQAQPQHDWRLELAGDGPNRSAIEEQIARLGLQSRVSLLGMLPHEDMVRCLWRWHVGVVSSLGETQSLAAMEAMLCGLPLVATRVAGNVETVTDGQTGLLVPATDSSAMATALERLSLDGDLRGRLSQSARTHAIAQFSSSLMWSRYRSYIEDLSQSSAAIYKLPEPQAPLVAR